jgi:hypothetical protein
MEVHIMDRGADSQCKDGARFFWPCTEIIQSSHEGYTQQVVSVTKEQWNPPDYRTYHYDSALANTKTLPRWTRNYLQFGAPEGTKNTTCFKIAASMARRGFSPDEIVDIIMNSPIPVDKSDNVRREVTAAVKSGYNRRGHPS